MIPVLPDRTLNHLLTILENACKAHNVKNILTNAEDIMCDEKLEKMMAVLYELDRKGANKTQIIFDNAYQEYDKLRRKKKTTKFFLVRYVEACKVHALADEYRYEVKKLSAMAALKKARREADKRRRKTRLSSESGNMMTGSFNADTNDSPTPCEQGPAVVYRSADGESIAVYPGTIEKPTVVVAAGAEIPKDLPKAATTIILSKDMTGNLARATVGSQPPSDGDHELIPVIQRLTISIPAQENDHDFHDDLEDAAYIADALARYGDSASLDHRSLSIVAYSTQFESDDDDEFSDARSTFSRVTYSSYSETISDSGMSTSSDTSVDTDL